MFMKLIKDSSDINGGDSERSDEYIDFTMICAFFMSVITFWSSKSAPIFRLSPVSDRKVNPVVFQSIRKNPKKVTEKQEFLRKTKYVDTTLLLAFEVQILTKIRQNHKYLQIIFIKCSVSIFKKMLNPPSRFFFSVTALLIRVIKFYNMYNINSLGAILWNPSSWRYPAVENHICKIFHCEEFVSNFLVFCQFFRHLVSLGNRQPIWLAGTGTIAKRVPFSVRHLTVLENGSRCANARQTISQHAWPPYCRQGHSDGVRSYIFCASRVLPVSWLGAHVVRWLTSETSVCIIRVPRRVQLVIVGLHARRFAQRRHTSDRRTSNSHTSRSAFQTAGLIIDGIRIERTASVRSSIDGTFV
ncbi:hypothetical protein AGLY_015164 [Aphis glycines]|uniref:Uncharacterized protein n=1 Tax=Aphis glycines TaxID=307491 RepID=A0A6G0T1D4_APHGL|nr:hypothetical protein AGLY_015164 [Aphis glycines]